MSPSDLHSNLAALPLEDSLKKSLIVKTIYDFIRGVLILVEVGIMEFEETSLRVKAQGTPLVLANTMIIIGLNLPCCKLMAKPINLSHEGALLYYTGRSISILEILPSTILQSFP